MRSEESVEEPTEEVEVLDALPVLVDVHPLEPARVAPKQALVQTAAVAATGFVAGAATVAVLGRHLQRQLARPHPRRRSGVEVMDVVASRTFLVRVHELGRRE